MNGLAHNGLRTAHSAMKTITGMSRTECFSVYFNQNHTPNGPYLLWRLGLAPEVDAADLWEGPTPLNFIRPESSGTGVAP